MATILVIDDDKYIRKTLVKILEKEGYQVIEAADGEIGLRLCFENKPQLVITDIVMPNVDGIEVITRLRKDLPELKIIAISGGGHRIGIDLALETAISLGIEYTIKKPYERAEIVDTVKKLLSPTTR